MNIKHLLKLQRLAGQGAMPPQGDLSQAQAVFGFSFGVIFDEAGNIAEPGATNRALAAYIVNNPQLRQLEMYLQEELANAVLAADQTLAKQVHSLPSLQRPGKAYNSLQLIQAALPVLQAKGIKRLVIVAFRYHLPRATVHLERAGFEVTAPDLRQTGDFDPRSSQAWTRSRGTWVSREMLAIWYFGLRGQI